MPWSRPLWSRANQPHKTKGPHKQSSLCMPCGNSLDIHRKAKVSFYGLYLYNEGQVRIWPYARANGDHTVDVLRRLRAEIPIGTLIVLWDGAPYHRAKTVWSAAASLDIHLLPLPSYSPDLMAVEPLWRWLREDVTYHHCHPTAEDLIRRVAAFEADVNADPYVVADRLWVKDHLDPEEERLRFSK